MTTNREHDEFRLLLSSFSRAKDVAGNAVAAYAKFQQRLDLVADRLTMRTAGMKTAA